MTKPYFFDSSDPDGPGLFPQRAATWIIDRLADRVRETPHWRFESGPGGLVRVELLSHQPGRSAEIGVSFDGRAGTLSLAPDGTGWLVIRARIGAAEVLAARLDQPFEDYRLLPMEDRDWTEDPGRMGKRANWIALSVAAWPMLALLARNGTVELSAVDG